MTASSRLRVLVALALLSGALSGCALLVVGAAVGAGAIVYTQGELRSTEAASLDRTFLAAVGSLTQLGFTVADKRKDAFYGRIEARTAKGEDITVVLDRKGDNATEVGIRVGVVGDEEISRAILDELKRRL